MIQIENIIFDLDGTLIDSKKVIIDAVYYTLDRLSLERKTEQQILAYIGTGTRELIEKVTGSEKEDTLDKGVELFKSYWGDHFEKNSKLFPNVLKVLGYFKNKKKLLLTNGNWSVVRKVLEKFDIEKYFETTITGDEQECLKPSSCPIDKALKIENIGNKRETIIVGDMDVDILSGKEAGIRTCGVTYGMGDLKEIQRADPDFIIDNIIELTAIIE